LTSEYVERVLNMITSALRSAGFPDEYFGGYADHLTAVKNGFVELRSSAMFVDYANGLWSSDRPVSRDFLQKDVVALGFFVSLAEDALEEHASFQEIVAKFEVRDRELREDLRKLFQGLARIASGSQGTPEERLEEQLKKANMEKDFGTGG
jgi:hypothetical protein